MLGTRPSRPARAAWVAVLALASARAAVEPPPAPAPHRPAAIHDLTRYGPVYWVPDMESVTVRKDLSYKRAGSTNLALDLYLPAGAPSGTLLPVVVFVNGVGDAPGMRLKEWGQYRGWPRLAAAHGLAGVSFDARPDPDNLEDLRDLFRWLREHGREEGLDPDRVALWCCSANARNAYTYMMTDAGAWLRAAVIYYGSGEGAAIRADLPVELVRSGRDNPFMNQAVDRFAAAASAAHAPWTVVNLPDAHHGFDCVDDTDASRVQIRRTLEFLLRHLASGSPPDFASLPRGSAPPAGAPDVPPPDARAAMALFFGREWPEAASAYAAWVERHPDDVDAWLMLGNARVESRDVEGARAALTRAKALDPTIGETYALLGRLEAQQRRYDAALPLLQRAIEVMPDDAESRHQLGGVLLAQKRYPEAVAMLEEAVRLAPGNGFAWNKLAGACMATGNYARAVEGFQRVLTFVPNDAIVLYNFACANARAGNAAAALDALDRSVANGFKDKSGLTADPDLESLRGETRFQEILRRLE